MWTDPRYTGIPFSTGTFRRLPIAGIAVSPSIPRFDQTSGALRLSLATCMIYLESTRSYLGKWVQSYPVLMGSCWREAKSLSCTCSIQLPKSRATADPTPRSWFLMGASQVTGQSSMVTWSTPALGPSYFNVIQVTMNQLIPTAPVVPPQVRYLDPPNPPQTPSQKVLGALGCREWDSHAPVTSSNFFDQRRAASHSTPSKI